MRLGRRCWWIVACPLLIGAPADADPPGAAPRAAAPPSPLTLEAAVRFALDHHPGVATARTQVRVAEARTDIARAEELPQVALVGEVLRGTGTVLPGSIFALPGVPSVTGMSHPFDAGAFGCAIGASASWDLTDLVRRMALVDAALADQRTAGAGVDARRLEVAYQAADAFVAAVDANEAIRSAQSNLDRARTFATQVHALSDQQLRPGADAARADAEVAAANTLMARALQAQGLLSARLAEALGTPGISLQPQSGAMLDALPSPSANGGPQGRHPLLVQADDAVRAAELRRRAVGLEYLPRVQVVSALWLRGSGYGTASGSSGTAAGLVPDSPNWALGLVAAWPIMELLATRARVHAADAQIALERARRAEVEQALAGQLDAARAVLTGAVAIARQTQPALDAARESYQQALARYQSGLGTAVDVADAQRVLTAAEIADIDARIGVRRAMLLVARATGDLSPFVVDSDRRGGH